MRNHKIKIEQLPSIDNGHGFKVPACVVVSFSYMYGENRVTFENMKELMRFCGSLQEAVLKELHEMAVRMGKDGRIDGAVCGDDRFRIINDAKADLIRSTNIGDCPEEMDVLDSMLFRCWQMGWLDKYEKKEK